MPNIQTEDPGQSEADLKEELIDLLDEIFDLYDEGIPCYLNPGDQEDYIGVAIHLEDETVNRIQDILEHHRPQAAQEKANEKNDSTRL